jgi:hypothetical protein
VAADPTLAVFIGSALLLSAAVGTYVGINRARAPLHAPEAPEVVERRRRFKAEHLGSARVAVFITAVLFLAALGVFIAAHA